MAPRVPSHAVVRYKPEPHWDARYVWNRANEKLWRRGHQGEPWLTATAVDFLRQWLQDSDSVLEFGSGMSTHWFANRVKDMVSVEHDRSWFRRTSQSLPENVAYHFCPEASDYISMPSQLDDASFELVVIDGVHRPEVALASVRLVAPGGVLLVDNSERYMPSGSSAPKQGTKRDSQWCVLETQLKDWRKWVTTNGVWDTTLFFRSATQ